MDDDDGNDGWMIDDVFGFAVFNNAKEFNSNLSNGTHQESRI